MNSAPLLLLSLLVGAILGACTALVQVEEKPFYDKPDHTNIKDWYLPPCDKYVEDGWAEYKCKANSGQGSHQ